MIKRMVVLLLASILLSACGVARLNQQMDSWVGKPSSLLVEQWGPPSNIFEDGEVKIYTYKETTIGRNAGTTFAVPVGSGIYAAQNIGGYIYNYEQIRMFWIDKSGVITKTAWKGI